MHTVCLATGFIVSPVFQSAFCVIALLFIGRVCVGSGLVCVLKVSKYGLSPPCTGFLSGGTFEILVDCGLRSRHPSDRS